MKQTQTKYALKNKKTSKLIGYHQRSNHGAEFAIDITIKLDEKANNVWLSPSAEHVLWVLHNPTQWYNADMETPNHNLDPKDYMVVKYEETIEVTDVDVTIPTFQEISAFLEYTVEPFGKLCRDVGYEYSLFLLHEYYKKKSGQKVE